MPHTVLLAESKAIVHKSNYLYVLIRPLVQTAASVVLLEVPFRPKWTVFICTKKWRPAIRGGSRFSAIWQSGEFRKFLCSVKFASPQDRQFLPMPFWRAPREKYFFAFSKFDVSRTRVLKSKYLVLLVVVFSIIISGTAVHAPRTVLVLE